MKTKNSMIILGVSFVWFTTHFGGGFASGAQIYSYFTRFGIWCLIMPVIAMLYNAIFFSYSLYFAKKHNVYDYRSYNNAFYGKFSPIFSNLFEILYICVMCVAPAVAFATGGATLSTLTGMPYMLCTLIIGVFIFTVSIFGTNLVRKVAWIISICIIVGLFIVYLPNILTQLPKISNTISSMKSADISFTDALYSAFLYGTFQLSNIAVFVQHAKSFEKPKDAVKSMGIGFIINSIMMIIVVIGLMTIYTNPEAATQSVPTLFMVKNGVGSAFMTSLISILIILGAVSTAVNMVAAMVKRICGEKKEVNTNITSKKIIAALICCIIDFAVAQFGLLTLVQKAYGFLAYLAIPVILIPYVIHMILSYKKAKNISD